MRTRLRITYLIVAIVSLTVAYLTAILFLRLTMVDYVRASQIKDSQPFQQFFVQYYQAKNGWSDIGQVDIDQLIATTIPDQNAEFGLTLVTVDGNILLSSNKGFGEIKVDGSTMAYAAPVVVAGDTVAYLFAGSLHDRLLPKMDGEIIIRAQDATNWATIVGALVGFIMSIFMARTLLRPIDVTIDAVKKISQGEIGLRVPVEPYRDMAELGQAVNDMAVNLEKNQQYQKLMIMDIAHDLRTPLSVQKATIEAFEDKVYPFDEEGLALLKRQNSQLILLVEDLRLLTLSEEGMLTVRKEQVPLNLFIQAILTSFESILVKKDIRMVFNPAEDDFLIDIDPHLMQRVFENLLQNAYQHSPEGCEISLRILRMISRVQITLTDQGLGIPENKLDTIFNRYYRVNSAEAGVPEGLGIGLTISRRIVEAHGGKLYARNTAGKGAEFVLELPYST